MIKIKLDVKPMNKVKFLKDKEVPQGTTQDDYTFVSIKIGSKKQDMTLIGAKYSDISDSELTAVIFQGITEALYNKSKPEEKVVIDGKEVELKQVIQ